MRSACVHMAGREDRRLPEFCTPSDLAGTVQGIFCTTLSTSPIKAARDGGVTREATHPTIVRNHRGYLPFGSAAAPSDPILWRLPAGFSFWFLRAQCKNQVVTS